MASSTIPPLVIPATTSSTSSTTQQNQNHIPVISNLPPQSNTTNYSNFNPKKRPLDHVYLLQSSPYFKIRAILKDLRPLFIEVLRAPDFQNCEAAGRIRERMKLMVEICRVPNITAGGVDFASEKQGVSQNPTDQRPQDKRFSAGTNFEKPTQDSIQIQGTYIVGGSAFGWNFITFHGTKPVYYGRTKEAFRAGK